MTSESAIAVGPMWKGLVIFAALACYFFLAGPWFYSTIACYLLIKRFYEKL